MAGVTAYPRDLLGHGRKPPQPRWPNGARIALQFVLNHEEGGENNVLHGDAASETFLSEIIGAQAFPMRHMSMESLYEYGTRAGLWRVLRAFERRGLPLTIFAVAMALKRMPEAAAAFAELGHEIACHGLRWISYQNVDEATERAHLREAVDILREVCGHAPLGWYTGRDSPNTRRLVVEHGGFAYDADSYADDLPYWTQVETAQGTKSHLVVPYTLDSNDMRFATAQGFNTGTQFYDYLCDAFDTLYAEGDPDGLDAPKMLSIGLHSRIVGRPGRINALERFLDYALAHDKVWIARRIDIAQHWIATFPATGYRRVITLAELNAATHEGFVEALNGIYEHSPWVAGHTANARPLTDRFALLDALNASMLAAPRTLQLALVRAHPELAGKAAIRGELTAASTREQAGAGLSACSPDEYARLLALNADYNARFGFPFILAVKGHDRASILSAFEHRLGNDVETELQTALHQIGRIAAFRLGDRISEPPGKEIVAMCERLARHSEQADGLTCTYLTPVHRATAAQLRDWMLEAGLEARLDPVGNVVGRWRSNIVDARVLMTGSHYDTVVNGGKFDGRLGIVLPIVVTKILKQRGIALPFDLDIAGFSEEEGVRYQSTFLGSSAIAGCFDAALLDRMDADGIAMREAMKNAGHDPASIEAIAREADDLLGFVEVHIEQGPVLLDEGMSLGVVTAINGSLRYLVTVTGLAGHAGTVPMNLRRDAAAAAAEIVLFVERRCGSVPGLVGTVGRLEVPGGAVNVIPGRCELSLDIRAPDDAVRDAAAADILAEIAQIAARRRVLVEHRQIVKADATACSEALQTQLDASIRRVTGAASSRLLASGAGHDAMQMAALTEVGMLFVRCGNGGISHHPDETLSAEDADVAALAFADFLEHFPVGAEPEHSPRRSGDGWLKAFSSLLNV